MSKLSGVTVNPAALSKINWVNVLSAAAAVAAIFGLDLPPERQAQIVSGLAVLTPVVTVILRTFFTAKP